MIRKIAVFIFDYIVAPILAVILLPIVLVIDIIFGD